MPSRPLVTSACRADCAWDRTGVLLDGEPVFACAGCGSEWVPSERWTPADRDGEVPEAVQRVRDFRGGG